MDGAEVLRAAVEFMNSRNESLNQNKTVKQLIDDFFIEGTTVSNIKIMFKGPDFNNITACNRRLR